MKIKYSEQANLLIENFKSFDKVDFEKWFDMMLAIGSNNILEYLLYKKKLELKKKELVAQSKALENK